MKKKVSGAEEIALPGSLAFLQRLWELNHSVERMSLAMKAHLGITAQQRFVLRMIGNRADISGGELAAVLHLDPGTISTSLRRLELRKLITRKRDPADRRREKLSLTRLGEALNHPSRDTVEGVVEELLRTAEPRRIAATLETMGELAAFLQRGAVRGRAKARPNAGKSRKPTAARPARSSAARARA